ncbi:MAG: selenide, water dikinase SelD [Halioglobus sp.]
MQSSSEISQDLVLVGGGHAHVIALRMLAMQPMPGVRITLISPATHTPYSGMLPGLVAGHYTFEETHIDLARLCQWAGVRFLRAEVTAIEPGQRVLTLRDRPAIHYEILSLDIGSEPELDSVPGARQWSVPIKPVASLWQRWSSLSARLDDKTSDAPHGIAVVGGGAGSVELIMAMAQRFSDRTVNFELFCGGDSILQGYNARARKSVEIALQEVGIGVHLGTRVESVADGVISLSDKSSHNFDDLFWCTGASAAPWVSACDLATDDSGFLAIRDTLQSVNYDNIFAAGDVATQVNHPRPKAGVYAVRQGPVLAENLRNVLLGKPLKIHIPQHRFLSLVSLGGKTATADRSFLSATGNWVWRWKDRIDRKFMRRFIDLPSQMSSQKPGELQQMPCGGCGAKVGAGSLSVVLSRLAVAYPEHASNGLHADDTAIIPGAAGHNVVQSIDVLREIVADPWLMGRIAANHALSDLYASGARPLSALATVTLPFASPSIQERDLEQLLAGALHEFKAVNCPLQGGHSLQGQELNIGFVVNGHPISLDHGYLSKTGLQTGNLLVLTKPIGSGALFAGHMQLKADGRNVQAAIECMLQSNALAAMLAVEFGASACTDVTGFGLLGHLLEMLNEKIGANLKLSSIPQLQGALECIQQGVLSTMHVSNAAALAALGDTASSMESHAVALLVDPQTSGGLLIGIAPEQAEPLCAALRDAGYLHSAVIGEVTELSDESRSPLLLM